MQRELMFRTIQKKPAIVHDKGCTRRSFEKSFGGLYVIAAFSILFFKNHGLNIARAGLGKNEDAMFLPSLLSPPLECCYRSSARLSMMFMKSSILLSVKEKTKYFASLSKRRKDRKEQVLGGWLRFPDASLCSDCALKAGDVHHDP